MEGWEDPAPHTRPGGGGPGVPLAGVTSGEETTRAPTPCPEGGSQSKAAVGLLFKSPGAQLSEARFHRTAGRWGSARQVPTFSPGWVPFPGSLNRAVKAGAGLSLEEVGVSGCPGLGPHLSFYSTKVARTGRHPVPPPSPGRRLQVAKV